MRCPICHKPVEAEAPELPFCSRRCRVQDLANWAEGVYRVPVKPKDEPGAGGSEDGPG